MNRKKSTASRWLYCACGDRKTLNLWSRLNLEGSGITWAGNPIRGKRSGFIPLLFTQPVKSHTDETTWTSESDALGEWGVVWGP